MKYSFADLEYAVSGHALYIFLFPVRNITHDKFDNLDSLLM